MISWFFGWTLEFILGSNLVLVLEYKEAVILVFYWRFFFSNCLESVKENMDLPSQSSVFAQREKMWG